MSGSHVPRKPPTAFAVEPIYRCLAPCNECTGDYVSEMLQKRLVCLCPCGHGKNRNNNNNNRQEKFALQGAKLSNQRLAELVVSEDANNPQPLLSMEDAKSVTV